MEYIGPVFAAIVIVFFLYFGYRAIKRSRENSKAAAERKAAMYGGGSGSGTGSEGSRDGKERVQ